MTATVPTQGFNGAQTKYSYDPLYQLQKAEYPNVTPFNGEIDQWTYDAIGNRLTNQINATIQNYTYEKIAPNPKNAQKLLGDGTNTYTYYDTGSQSQRLGLSNYGFIYDPDNRLSSIDGAETASYTYDYQGRRTSKTVGAITTRYLYDGLDLITETTNGTTTLYVFGPSIDEPLAVYTAGAVSYVAVDGLGSAVVENNTTGTVLHSSIFDVWGVTKTETGTRFSAFGYTGREFAEAGLWAYRARQFRPATGQFTQEDPLSERPSPYSYVGSSPVGYTDPLGEFRTGQVLNRKEPDGGEDIIVVVHDGNPDADRNTTLNSAVLIATFGPPPNPRDRCGKGVIVPALSKQDPYGGKEVLGTKRPVYDEARDTGKVVTPGRKGETTEETIRRRVDEWNSGQGHCYGRLSQCSDFVSYLLRGVDPNATTTLRDFPPIGAGK